MTTVLTRRRTLIAAGLSSLGLTACGFRLRGAFEAPFETMYLQMRVNSPIYNRLKRALTAGSNIRIVSSPKEAQAVLELLKDTRQSDVLSINDSGQAREYQLSLTLEFRVSSPEGFDWLEATTLTTTRDMTYSEVEFLSRSTEEELLYKDMETDLVNQIVRHIEAIRPRPAQR